MSARKLPEPPGPHIVGSDIFEINDSSRTSHILRQERGRKIIIKFWYPANPSAVHNCEREQLWEQLRTESHIPGFAKLLLRRAMKTETNSYRRAPYAANFGTPRVLIYNHGLISFASENTMLMEHLASQGYTLVSLQHKEQLAEIQALKRNQPEREKKEQDLLQKQIQAAKGNERAELSKRYFEIASNTNHIVSARTADVEHVVKSLKALLGLLSAFGDVRDPEILGVLGFSLGGAVATEYSKQNTEISCAVNIDGGIYGEKLDLPITCPYLMLYSQQNSGSNDRSLITGGNTWIRSETIPDTKHLNFHDIASIYPILRLLKVVGKANPVDVLKRRNQLIADVVSNVETVGA
jgi:dienelactone hydrolase